MIPEILATTANATQPDVQITGFEQHFLFYFSCVFSTIVAAIAGATASTRVRMDVFGIIMCGALAALGGGTVRDILLSGVVRPDGSQVQIFWVTKADEHLLYLALLTSLAIFFITRFVRMPAGTIRVADAFSMAFFTLIGAAKAQHLGCPMLVCICMGVCTGVAGGILRDIATGNVPYVFRSNEVYASAAFAGCVIFFLLQYFGMECDPAFLIGTAVAFIVRMAAVYFCWTLPTYRPLFEGELGHEHAADYPEEQNKN